MPVIITDTFDYNDITPIISQRIKLYKGRRDMTKDEIRALLNDLESDRVGRTIQS